MAIAFVQKTARFTASAASSVTSGALTTTPGNTAFLTIATWVSAGSTAPTITDSKGNTGTVNQSTVDGLGKVRASIGSIPLVSGGAGHSWTINFLSGTYGEGNVSEFSGIASSPFDVAGSDSYNSTAGVTSLAPTTATTAQANELVVGCIVTNNADANTNVSDPPSGFTSIGVQADDTQTIGYEAAYKVVAAIGTQSATWTFDPTPAGTPQGAASVATYKAATTGSSGTLAKTNANDTSAASGTTTVKGSLARTNTNDTSAASGKTTVKGSLSRTNTADTSSASGKTTVVGSAARTNANDTANASGSIGGPVSGSLAKTNANDAVSASGTTVVQGSLATSNANDTASASGSLGGAVSGSLATTNANDTLSGAGTTAVLGSVAAQNAPDQASATGQAGDAPSGPTPAGIGRKVAIERHGRIELFENEKELEAFLKPVSAPAAAQVKAHIAVAAVVPAQENALGTIEAPVKTRTFDPLRPNRRIRRAEINDDEEAILVLLM